MAKRTKKTAAEPSKTRKPRARPHVPKRKSNEDVIQALQSVARSVEQAAEQGEDPSISIPVRALSNVFFDTHTRMIQMGNARQDRNFFSLNMARKFMQTVLVASGCKQLKLQTKTTSIRDLYYMLKHTIGKSRVNTLDGQEESDPVIEDLEVALDCLREELNLHASNKGALVGELTLEDAGDTIDARRMGSGGWSIPSIVEPDVVKFKESSAKFILLVEKDAMWRRLNEDKFWRKYGCILLHGQGQPPRGVRRLLSRMVNELKLPLYVFVDNDPWGYYIYSVVKQGSINLAYESRRMAVPQARFIGLAAGDKERFKLSDEVTIKLTKEDEARAKQLMNYDWFKRKEWQKEIRRMLKNGYKMELEALSNRGLSFVTEEYLPQKIRDKDYLD